MEPELQIAPAAAAELAAAPPGPGRRLAAEHLLILVRACAASLGQDPPNTDDRDLAELLPALRRDPTYVGQMAAMAQRARNDVAAARLLFAVLAIDPQAAPIDGLQEAARAADATHRWLRAYAAQPSAAVGRIAAHLASDRASVRGTAVEALGQTGDARATSWIAEAARADDRPEVRARAIVAFARRGTPDAWAQITRRSLEDSSPRVRRVALLALARAGATGHEYTLLRAAEADTDPEIRLLARRLRRGSDDPRGQVGRVNGNTSRGVRTHNRNDSNTRNQR